MFYTLDSRSQRSKTKSVQHPAIAGKFSIVENQEINANQRSAKQASHKKDFQNIVVNMDHMALISLVSQNRTAKTKHQNPAHHKKDMSVVLIETTVKHGFFVSVRQQDTACIC